MKRKHLSPDEREEYDALLTTAGFADDGSRDRAHLVGDRMHQLLEKAHRSGQSWAGWVLAADSNTGHWKRWTGWDNDRNKIRTITDGGLIVPKNAVVGVRRRKKGSTYYQRAFWHELTWTEVEQKLDESWAQIGALRITAGISERLLALRKRVPESAGPAEACLTLGVDMEAYLAGEQAVA